jgi:diguanylate cyclase (GGDEF)-like protein
MGNSKLSTSDELENLIRQLGLALEASGIGIWQHNISRNQTRWDEQLKAIYGVPKGPLDVVWLDSVHPEDVEATNHIFQTAIRQKTDYASQFRIIRPDHSIRHIRSRARYFIDVNGEPCFIGAEWDVTEDVLRNQELQQRQAEARYAADHDYLTGLLNRRSFDTALATLAQNPDTHVSICHIDIDRFKEINDRLGHAGGDIVLHHLSLILSQTVGDKDVAARLGGDEFAVLCVDSSDCSIDGVAKRIQSALEQPIPVNGQFPTVQCSIGIASAKSNDLTKLLSHSAVALYQAKRNGRNRCETFSPAMASNMAGERQLVADLRAALEVGQVVPFYQVQVDAKTLKISGIEALARWRHPSRGLLQPAEFLAIATNNSLIAAIDEAILKAVLVDVDLWSMRGVEVPRISVNLSAERLNDPLLIEKLNRLNIPAGRISFELIETIFLDSLNDQIKANLEGIRDLGIEIEIDDLGSGHASLLGLVELRPDRVKIDRQLVAPILQSVTRRRLVGSLVDIAKTLDIQVVAEGVETFEHADVLADLGVEFLQGYAFGRPEVAHDFEKRLLGKPLPVRRLA